MLGRDHPRASIHPDNIANSCRSSACHPGADKGIAATAVHLDLPAARGSIEFIVAATFILLTILTFGPSALLVLLDLLQIVVGRRFHGGAGLRALTERVLQDPRGRERLKRFKVRHRVQHWLLTLLFVLLVLTGFPLKFADRSWAAGLVSIFGGLQAARTIHHWAGVLLVAGFFAHLVDVFFVFWRRARERIINGDRHGYRTAFVSLPMWINPGDVRKTFHLFASLLFLRRERPTFGRFSPTEKFEYLGVFWGTMLLGVTGALLWGEQMTSHVFGGRAFNIATIAHTYEAFLAVIHVGILHIYNVILAPRVFPLSPATLTGHTPVDKLVEEHSELVEEVARDLGLARPTEEADATA
jgi:cytochrome b subunit of formate dehydrogenase